MSADAAQVRAKAFISDETERAAAFFVAVPAADALALNSGAERNATDRKGEALAAKAAVELVTGSVAGNGHEACCPTNGAPMRRDVDGEAAEIADAVVIETSRVQSVDGETGGLAGAQEQRDQT